MTKNSVWIFDESYFIDSITGGFCFPQYHSTGEHLVEIDDTTDYLTCFWGNFDLTPGEISRYSITDFERNLSNADSFELEITIDSLEEFIRKIPSNFFRLFPKLERYRKHLAKLICKFGSEDAWYGSYNEVFRDTLMEYNLSCQCEQYMKGTIEWGGLVKKICHLYVYYLKSNLERFHPLYIPIVFEILNDYYTETVWMEDEEFFLKFYDEEYSWLEILHPLITRELKSKYWLQYRKKI